MEGPIVDQFRNSAIKWIVPATATFILSAAGFVFNTLDRLDNHDQFLKDKADKKDVIYLIKITDETNYKVDRMYEMQIENNKSHGRR